MMDWSFGYRSTDPSTSHIRIRPRKMKSDVLNVAAELQDKPGKSISTESVNHKSVIIPNTALLNAVSTCFYPVYCVLVLVLGAIRGKELDC
jgi:hypothetical protein